MPVYGEKKLVTVPMPGIANALYGWRREDAIEVLGHTEVVGDLPAGIVIGARAPRPAKATRVRIDGTDSTFCATASRATAIAAGWSVGQPRFAQAANTARTRGVYVNVGGIKYYWPMPLVTYNAIADHREGLGIEDATSEDVIVVGASYPKPPKVSRKFANGNRVSSREFFISPTSLDSLPAGYTKSKDGKPARAN